VEHAREKYEVSERHPCWLLGQWRRTQRYAAIPKIDEEALTEAIVALASEYGRYGYRRISSQEVLGRTATAKASTGSCGIELGLLRSP
jgi:hypothetical protein